MQTLKWRQIYKTLVPTRMLGLLMAVGFLDLISTAILHAQGLIVEVNPLMKPLIEHSEWTFAVVKAFTLVLAWAVMVRHAQQAERNVVFVRQACLVGAVVYISLWVGGVSMSFFS